VEFGGLPYCSYSVTLSNVVASLRIDESNNVQSQVTNTGTEIGLRGCPYPTGPPSADLYTLQRASLNGRTLTAEYGAARGNYPQARLSFSATVSADQRSVVGALTWHRIDQPSAPSLQWTITSPITLSTP
jgi:hypothetical protein